MSETPRPDDADGRMGEEREREIRAACEPSEKPGPCPVCGEARVIGSMSSDGVKWACYAKRTGHGWDTEHYRESIVVQPYPPRYVPELLDEIDRLRGLVAVREKQLERYVRYWWEQHQPDERDREHARAAIEATEVRAVLDRLRAAPDGDADGAGRGE